MIRTLFLTLLVGMGATCCIGAPRQLTATPSQTPVAALVQVVVPGSTCAAVSETQSLLAIGRRAPKGKQLVIYSLDPATGNPSVAPAAEVALPTSAALQAFENYPLCVKFHPVLPLLYVWQDINAPEMPATADDTNPVYKEFDHLLIYSVQGNGMITLVQSLARGPGFGYKQILGSIEIDPVRGRLFMPNLRSPKALVDTAASTGYYQLDVQGFPARTVAQPVPTPKVMSAFDPFPTGLGFGGASKDAVIYGALNCAVVWEFDNRRVNASKFYIHRFKYLTVTGSSKFPFVYMTGIDSPYILCMEHVDGFLTLLPQRLEIDNARMQSAAVVMTKQNKIAVGGLNIVYAIKLDANGRYTTEVERSPIAAPKATAIAYSEKLDRLYVGVEALK
ncbi:MAG: hypothetical protein ABIP97_04150 [Chthoniobacterales bacterium]